MTYPDQKAKLRELHIEGWKGLKKIYGGFKYASSKNTFRLPLYFSIVVGIIIICIDKSGNEILDIVKKIVNIGIAVDGGLVGLSLAGLTLLVTFGSENLMRKLVEIRVKSNLFNEESKFSSYQSSVSKFSWAVLVQVITLIVLIGIYILFELHFSTEFEIWNRIVNLCILVISIFLLFYSLGLILQMTINIFTISQMNHGAYYVEEVDKLMKELEEKE